MGVRTQFKAGHKALEGCGRPIGSKTQCKEIRAKRRENALVYAVEQQERLKALEEAITADSSMRSEMKYRLLIDIERIRQNEITLSVPTEQSIKMEDEKEVKSSRRLLFEKSELLIVKE